MRHKIKLVISLTAAFLLFYVATDFVARLLIAHLPDKIIATLERSTRVPAYANAAYWSDPEFWKERSEALAHLDGDFAGQYYNIRKGRRATTDTPPTFAHTVYIFGASTVISIELPDEGTLPSQIQKIAGSDRVINMGTWGTPTDVDLDNLRNVPLQPGDTVIFYGAMNDAQAPYYAAYNRLQCTATWAVLQLLCRFQKEQPPAELSDPAYIAAATAGMRARWIRNIEEAHRHVVAHGALFFAFLQPHIWAAPMTDYEKYVADAYSLPGGNAVILSSWQALQSTLPELRQEGIEAHDLTGILTPYRQAGEALFFDSAHVNERGNAIIARAIFDQLTIF